MPKRFKKLSLLALIILNHYSAQATSTDSVYPNMHVLTTDAKIKYVKIDYDSANWLYVPMNGSGCPTNGNTRYVQIGVKRMPNVYYAMLSVNGEYDFHFSQKDKFCFTFSYAYEHIDDGSLVRWVVNFGYPTMICAPVTVEWK